MRDGWLWGLSLVAMLAVALPAYFAVTLAADTFGLANGRLYAVAVAYGLGFSAGSVIQGTTGTGTGLFYHAVRSRPRRLLDFWIVAAVATGCALAAGLGVRTVAGELASELAALAAAVIASDVTFRFRRPADEQQAADWMRQDG